MKRPFTLFVLAVGVMGTIKAMLVASGSVSLGWLVFMLWAIFPYGLLAVVMERLRWWRVALPLQVMSVAVTGFGLYCYWKSFHPTGAQNGLVFVFIPLYQLAGAGLAGVVSVIVHYVTVRRHEA